MEPRARRRLRRWASRCSSEEEAVYGERANHSVSCASTGGVNGAHHVDLATPRSVDIWVCAAQRPTYPPVWSAPGGLASWGRVRGAVVVGGGQREGWGGRRGVVANLSDKAGVARGWRRPVAREGSGRCACPTRLVLQPVGLWQMTVAPVAGVAWPARARADDRWRAALGTHTARLADATASGYSSGRLSPHLSIDSAG